MKKQKSKTAEQLRAETSATLESLGPENTMMLGAWLGAIHWGISDTHMLAAFKADTGLSYHPPKSAIERMIDESTGADGAFLIAFVRWFNEHHWGAVNGRAASGDEPFNLSDEEIGKEWDR